MMFVSREKKNSRTFVLNKIKSISDEIKLYS